MKTVLVTVSGMSPAIITETVWALARESPPVIPDEVVVITTDKGEKDLRDMLLTPHEDWGSRTVWSALRDTLLTREYRNALQLSVRVVEVSNADTGVMGKAWDLRTRPDNDAAADFIIQTLAPYADAEDCRVIASIAGGRKTMGALLYAAMSLVGHEEDRVTHVLVSEPFENCKGFFFPDQPVTDLVARPFGQEPIPVKASDAQVEMADIGFVPLRNRFAELNEPRRTFGGLVEQYSRAPLALIQRAPRVAVDLEQETLTVEGREIRLSGREVIVAAFLCERARAGEPHFENRGQAEGPFDAFFQIFKANEPFHPAIQRLAPRLTEDDLTKGLAGIRKKLREKGLEGAVSFLAPERSRIGFDIAPDE